MWCHTNIWTSGIPITAAKWPNFTAAIRIRCFEYLAEDPDMRWTIDGTWIVQHYLATRKPSAQKAFLDLVRKDRIGMPAQYANLMTGTPAWKK